MASKPIKQESEAELRIVLVGKTGIGKSAVGNIILREKVFKSEPSSSSVTAECQKETGEFEGQKLAVVDTPGLFDTNRNEKKVKIELARSICLSAPGPHVILIVLQAGRFTPEEKETVKILQKMFEEKSADYMIALFTHGDDLEEAGKNIEEHIGENRDLRDFINQCHGGYHVFNNRNREDPSQVRELLEKIKKMIKRNGGDYYTNKMFEEAEKAIQEKMKQLLEKNPGMDPKKARTQAENDNSFITRVLAGAGAGAAVGAGVGLVGGPVGAIDGAIVGAVSVAVKEKLCVIQ